MLPNLTPLQYLVIHLLFAGPQTAAQLRRSLRAFEVRQSPSAFHRLMMRLVVANYVVPKSCKRQFRERTIYENHYEVTDFAVFEWLQVWKFHRNLAPPSADLMPVETDIGKLAAYDARTRHNVSEKQFRENLNRSIRILARKIVENKGQF